MSNSPTSQGRFGVHGGQYIPETLMNAVNELNEAYEHYKNDPEFNAELTRLFNEYAGRPSLLYLAERMTADLGGARTSTTPGPTRSTTCSGKRCWRRRWAKRA